LLTLPDVAVSVNSKVPLVSEFVAKLIVTFAVADPEPLRVTLVGDTLQVELRGQSS